MVVLRTRGRVTRDRSRSWASFPASGTTVLMLLASVLLRMHLVRRRASRFPESLSNGWGAPRTYWGEPCAGMRGPRTYAESRARRDVGTRIRE